MLSPPHTPGSWRPLLGEILDPPLSSLKEFTKVKSICSVNLYHKDKAIYCQRVDIATNTHITTASGRVKTRNKNNSVDDGYYIVFRQGK